MAKKSMIIKANRKPKFPVRAYNRCKVCGRPRGYMRKFQLCRICFGSGPPWRTPRCGKSQLVRKEVAQHGRNRPNCGYVDPNS